MYNINHRVMIKNYISNLMKNYVMLIIVILALKITLMKYLQKALTLMNSFMMLIRIVWRLKLT